MECGNKQTNTNEHGKNNKTHKQNTLSSPNTTTHTHTHNHTHKTTQTHYNNDKVRAEFLDITLAVLCFLAPELEARLKEVGPGRGRVVGTNNNQAGGGVAVADSVQLFALAEQLTDAVKKVINCIVLCV